MMQQQSWSGKNLREMFRTGTQLLSGNTSAVNALNVFPVPDGDTGTNMVLTMQSAMMEANTCPDNDASAVADAMARGALMGARGNSGVILSQILRGLARGLEGKKAFTSVELAGALLQASKMADKAVSKPTEGTILTVMRDAAAVVNSRIDGKEGDLGALVEALVSEARESVSRTPELLPVLRESGVVDAGGEGLRVLFEGLLFYLQGKEIGDDYRASELPLHTTDSRIQEKGSEYGYCTEFLVQGAALDLESMRARLHEIGEHVLVVGDERTARVHVHSFDPGAVISYGTSLGTLHRIKIDNMEEQHREFMASQSEEYYPPLGNISTVAVASGEGLAQVFKSLGATQVIHGGETMNPSVKELLEAVETVPTEEVLILPNNPDIIPTAQQVSAMAEKRVAVVPSKTIMHGVTALVAFNYETGLDANREIMTEAMSGVRTGQISAAIRSMQYGDLHVKDGQIIGFVDGELAVAEYTMEDALNKLLDEMEIGGCEILTVYYGSGVDWAQAESLFDSVRSRFPGLEIEVVYGGQPHYHYLISAE